jgi:hypothetical protein
VAKPLPGEIAAAAMANEYDPAGNYAFMIAHPEWQQAKDDPKYASYYSADKAFFDKYTELVTAMNNQILIEASQQAKMAQLISSGDVGGAVAYAHAGDLSLQDGEKFVQYLASTMKVHMQVTDGKASLVNNR